MSLVQTNMALRFLANLSCAVEDYQSFCESDDMEGAMVSADHCRLNIAGIREALDKLEDSLA